MESSYKYHAFISYRHLPLDQAVAERLQRLLEQYRPPKGIRLPEGEKRIRVFRDSMELPTSGNLDNALKRVLMESEYLVVVLSEETIHSQWCMAEIREFKAALNGNVSHILPIIVSGEPSEVIPEELRTSTVFTRNPDGSVSEEVREVEPLCADVRAESRQASLKKLKSEFLRIAASILGCGYDDLYRRHLRRKRKRIISFLSAAIALLMTVLTVIEMAKRG